MKISKRFLREESGQALVQFSVVAILLLILAGGTIDSVIIMRYHIAVSGAASEIANRITLDDTLDVSDINAICDEVINTNYHNTLGDGDTRYTAIPGSTVTDNSFEYTYHDYTYGNWSGYRKYKPVTVILEREQALFTPIGRGLFANSGDCRLIKGVAQTRAYFTGG